MPSGEALLDPRLPPQQPVEHVEHFVAADGTEAEQGTEAAGGGLRGQVLYFTLFRQNSSDYSDARPRNFLD